jgi:alanyl-tRNA synthetase
MVAPDVLRFDFTHGAGMSREEITAVEQTVTEQILAAQGMVTYEDVPLDDARKMGAMALFGEKYADRVRVVQVGNMGPGQPSFSRELCGGIHVGNTGEIGLFKILHESSAASGVRRITAVTGTKAVDWLNQQLETLHAASAKLKTNPHELISSIEKTLDTLREERKKREKLAQQGAGASAAEEHILGQVTLFVQKLEDADPADAKAISDRLVEGKPSAVALIVNVAGGKVTFVAKVGPDALKAGAKAGDLVKTVAQVTGGGGGGAPNFATAGGRDASKVDEAIAAGIAALQAAVS